MGKIKQCALLGLLTVISTGMVLGSGFSGVAQTPEMLEQVRDFLELNPPADEGEGGSRGNASQLICAISPTGEQDEALSFLEPEMIWSDRPLFLWHLKSEQLRIREVQVLRDDTDAMVWRSPVSPGQTSVLYSEEAPALEPGVVYYWQLVTLSPQPQPAFQILERDERREIDSELRSIQTILTAEGITPADITLAQALYFAEEDLFSDMLQYIYLVENPSEELRSIQDNIITELCPAQS